MKSVKERIKLKKAFIRNRWKRLKSLQKSEPLNRGELFASYALQIDEIGTLGILRSRRAPGSASKIASVIAKQISEIRETLIQKVALPNQLTGVNCIFVDGYFALLARNISKFEQIATLS